MTRKGLLIKTVLVVALVVMGVGLVPSAGALTVTTQGTFTMDCTGFTIATAGDYTMDRDNVGNGTELVNLNFYDGAGTLLFTTPVNYPVSTPWFWIVGAGAGWTTAPAYNPLSVTMVSVAGNGLLEEVYAHGTGTCDGLPDVGGNGGGGFGNWQPVTVPVPGCDATINIPSTAVVGSFVENAAVYWMPGEMVNPTIIMDVGKTAWVLGMDESGEYYRVLLSCEYFWVPVGTMGPNYDDVWNGTALPTDVVN